MTSRHWLALATVGAGAVSLTAMTLFAKGKRDEAFALAFTAGVLSTAFAAARVLSADAAPSLAKSAAPVDSANWGVAGIGMVSLGGF